MLTAHTMAVFLDPVQPVDEGLVYALTVVMLALAAGPASAQSLDPSRHPIRFILPPAGEEPPSEDP